MNGHAPPAIAALGCEQTSQEPEWGKGEGAEGGGIGCFA